MGLRRILQGVFGIVLGFSFLGGVVPAMAVDKSGVKPNVLSLPSGPGSIEGLGESFEPQLNSGTATYAIKLKAPPGRSGFSPTLALSYNSGNGAGPFGLGWKLDLPCLQRKTDKGLPKYDDSDIIVYLGGEELIPIGGGVFRFKNENEFLRFTKLGAGWSATRKDGVILTFGLNPEARIEDGTGRVFRWLLEEMKDLNGNTIRFFHDKLDDGYQRYFTRAEYNITASGKMSVLLEYEVRPDIITDYRPTCELKTAFRCKVIRMKESDRTVQTYLLSYEPVSNFQPLSLLSEVTHIGKDGVSSLPPAHFTYVAFQGDLAKPINMPSAPRITLNDTNIDLIDLNGDGLPDILDTNDTVHGYYLNRGPGDGGVVLWSGKTWMTSMPKRLYLGADTTQLADMDGDGRSDMLDHFGSDVQYYSPKQISEGIGWEWKGILAESGFNFGDPNVRLVDLNNDKMIDVMLTTSTHYYVWLNSKNGTWSQAITASSPNPNLKFDRAYVRLADMNGDRLQDLVWIDNESCIYYPSLGFGQFGSPVYMQNSPYGMVDQSRLLMADVNGDGLSDAMYVGSGTVKVWLNLGLDPLDHTRGRFADPFSVSAPYANSYTTFRQCDVNGNGSIDILWNTHPGGGDETFAYLDFATGEQPYQLKRITNGIGRTITVSYRSSVEDMVLDRNDGRPWPNGIPFPVSVIAGLEISDGLQVYSSNLRYHDGYYDGKEKEFRGFGSAERIEIGSTEQGAPTLVTSYQYDTGANIEALKGKPLVLEARTEDGEVFYRETNTWVTRELASGVGGDTRKVVFPYQNKRSRDVLEKGVGTPVRLEWQYEYDNYGNMTRQVEHGRTDPGWDDERVSEIAYTARYSSGISNWILDKPVEHTTKDKSGTVVAHKRNYYDENLSLGAVSKGNLTRVEDWVSETKYVASVRNRFDAYGNIIATYDPLYKKVSDGHYREFVYDDTYHTFPVQEIIYTGKDSPPTLTMSATYDFGLGVMTSSTGFNGFTTYYDHDTFGRLTSITKPPDTSRTVEYDYELAHDLGNGRTINWVETRLRDGSQGDGFLRSRTFYDGLSRKVMTRAEGEEPGQVVVNDTLQFNARQLPWKKYLPYIETGTLAFAEPTFNTGFTEHFYDALGREVLVHQPVGPEGIVYSTITYEPLSRSVRDEEQTKAASLHFGAGKRFVEDGLLDKDGKGRLREVYEIVKLSDKGEPLSAPVEWKTIYSYNLLGNLTSYIDSQGNQKVMEFDGLGRKTFMNDPDRGYMYYTYDDGNNLTRTTDAKGQVTKYEYDGINRLIAEYYGERKTSPDVEYHYDTPAGAVSLWQPDQARVAADLVLHDETSRTDFDLNRDGKVDVADVVKAARSPQQNITDTAKNTLGYLSWVKDQSGEEHNSYDARERSEWVAKRINSSDPGGTRYFRTSMRYDSMDRVAELVYPDQTSVTYTYNDRGLLESIPNVISRYHYNPAGQNSLLEFASGVVTTYGYDHRLRLSRLQSVRSKDNLKLQDLTYTYDGVSNITNISDGRSNAAFDLIGGEIGIDSAMARKFNGAQAFTYDSLYRLISASNPTVYGSINYRYDRIGNMISKAAGLIEPDPIMDLGAMVSGGNSGAWNRIGRKPGDPPGPHAVTATEKGPSGPMAFTYDDNGNMSKRGSMGLQWDYKDRITAISQGRQDAQYVYDYTGTRKRKTVADSAAGISSEVVYVDKFSEVRDGKLVKYLYDKGSRRIARSDSAASGQAGIEPTSFYLHDHLGSASLTFAADGSVQEQFVHYPYGEMRKQAGGAIQNNATDYTFTGKERDTESDLSYFEARYYDAAIGRFVSVDPLLESLGVVKDDKQSSLLSSLQGDQVYSYGDNNPVRYSDPSGLASKEYVVGSISSINKKDLQLLKAAVQDAAKQSQDVVQGFADNEQLATGVLHVTESIASLASKAHLIGKVGRILVQAYQVRKDPEKAGFFCINTALKELSKDYNIANLFLDAATGIQGIKEIEAGLTNQFFGTKITVTDYVGAAREFQRKLIAVATDVFGKVQERSAQALSESQGNLWNTPGSLPSLKYDSVFGTLQ